MTTSQAIRVLEGMPEAEFRALLKSLPSRTQVSVRGGVVSWKQAIAEWYVQEAA